VWFGFVALAYAIFVLGGVTTSSVGLQRLSETRGEPAAGVIAGTPRGIRADEYLRSTPWELGLLAHGSDDFATPLAHPAVALVAPTARDLPSAAMHLEAVALTLGLPLRDEIVFAAVWWLPVALVAALLPLWLIRLGAVPGIAVTATALVLLAPVNHWWSWWPMSVLAPALLAALGTMVGVDRWRACGANVLSVLLFGAAALCVARTVVAYVPWAIPLCLAVYAPTVAVVLASGRRRPAVVSLGAILAAGAIAAAAFVAQSAALDVITDTVYPGARRSIGEFVGLGLLFGAPHLWILQASPKIVGSTNESELSTAYLVLAAPGAVVAVGVRWAAAGALRASALAAGVVTAALGLWVVVDWPSAVGDRAFPLTLVPPARMAEVLGIAATIAFALVLSAWSTAPGLRPIRLAAVSGGLAGIVSLFGGLSLRDEALPTLPWGAVVFMACLVGVAVGLAVWKPRAPLALAALPLLAVLVVFDSNPLQRGFGDLRSSSAAASVRAAGTDLGEGQLWASDDPAFDALLMANGQPSLSGQQWIGPNEEAWRALDPLGVQRRVWNRGASYVVFRWETGAATRITLGNEDLIRVRIDPCAAGLRRLGLALVVSRHPLQDRCATLRGRIPWGDRTRWVYSLPPAQPS
jgi:hypothetical protein